MPALSLEKTALTLGLAMLSGAVLGLSPAGAALVIGGCALGVTLRFIARQHLQRASVFCLLFLIYVLVSGLLFGGFDSLSQSSFLGWIGNEGRVFLYYWPALFVFETTCPSDRGVTRVFRWLTIFVFMNTLVNTATGFSTFGTHHAAGAFAAMLVIFNLFRYGKSGNWIDLLCLVMAILALLGSNSRSALLATLVSVILVTISVRRIKQVASMACLAPMAIGIMAYAFPYQFERLQDAANMNTVYAVQENFARAYASNSPIEVAKAWELSETISLQGNANLAIRGYLFGRAYGEFARSPIVGIGFGRFNDIGRNFTGTPGLFFPVTDASFAAPSDQTAHNAYLQILAELGLLGALPLLALYCVMWRGLKHAAQNAPDWSKTGRASLICVCLMGITQHAFGAPIYGLSLFLLAALSFRKAQLAAS